MRKLIVAVIMAATAMPAFAQVRVDGHVRRDGTYVPPHSRSKPNNTTLDNWGTKGNTNPTTGQQGTRDPYSYPSTTSTRSPRSGCTYSSYC